MSSQTLPLNNTFTGGGNSGYGAPPSNSYSVPTYDAPAPSYNQPQPSYNPPSNPSYNQPSKPSYGGGKGPGKVIEIPIPNINLPKLPNPIEFKADILIYILNKNWWSK